MVLLEEGVDEGALFFGVMGVIKIGVDDAAEAFGGVGVGKEERYGCAAGDGAGLAGLFQRFDVHDVGTPVADFGEHLEIGGRHLVVAADEGGGDALELELHDSIQQRTVEGGAAVRVGAVVAVTLQLKGDLRADSVVGALHEGGRGQALFLIVDQCVEKFLGIFHAAQSRAGDDGVGVGAVAFLESIEGGDDGAFQQVPHAASFCW